MTFTAQLGTSDSMPGNIALGYLPPEGSGTGGPAPSATTQYSLASASGLHLTPAVAGSSETPSSRATHQKPGGS